MCFFLTHVDWKIRGWKEMLRPDYEKIIQAVNFFARKSNNQLTKLHILKLIFFADRYHMRMYGRMITNDDYLAMQYGPVASATKQVIEFISIPDKYSEYAAAYLKPKNDHLIYSLQDVDRDVFSETDIEALEVAWKIKEKVKKLVKYSHEFPEWKKHEEKLKVLSRSRMALEDFFLQAPEKSEYCNADESRVQINKEFFTEAYIG